MEDRCFMHALEAFWALVDLAGYPLIPASTLLQIWPNSVARSYGPKQVKVPENDDLPMPLDIAISLYLGLADRAFPAAFARVHGVDDPILAHVPEGLIIDTGMCKHDVVRSLHRIVALKAPGETAAEASAGA
ncbi:hypothetical protein TRAPUB_2614 [Trametes pubescens]|uniref:Uncharacterized protein n=1 Tax=Trametes pubescens TaxID=154538 RepID=A0A1M2VG70_TRAPU|nr:hypothetical protein TRAPUB_2614 [Trametes pubescens]